MGIGIRTTLGLTDLYVHFRRTNIAVVATEDTGLDAGWYEASDTAIAAQGLPTGIYEGVFLRGDWENPNPGDVEEGVFSNFAWDGTNSLDRIENIIAEIEDIEGGGVIIPVNQVPVPLARSWILKQASDGWHGESPLIRRVGESQPFAVDFRYDLPNNGRLVSLDATNVISGPGGGIVISTAAEDRGVDRSQAKFKVNLLAVGTYVIVVQATYEGSDGGGTTEGSVTLIVRPSLQP